MRRFSIAGTFLLAAAACKGTESAAAVAEGAAVMISSEQLVGLTQITPIGASVAGRRIVFFDLDQRALVDYDAASRTPRLLGRLGSGPGEYRLVIGTAAVGSDIVALDPQLRRIIRFDESGAQQRLTDLGLGGHRTILHYSDSLLLTGGMYSKAADRNGLYAVFSQWADGRRALSIRFELSETQIERRSTSLHIAKCGPNTIAVARSDSLFVLLLNQNNESAVRRMEFPASEQEWLAPDSQQSENEQLAQRQRIVQIVGAESGCVVMSARRTARADSARMLLLVRHHQQPIRWSLNSDEHLAALQGDTLHSIDFDQTPATWKTYRVAQQR